MALITAIARGGPRHGVKLSCPENWDGRIKKSEGRTGGIHWYPGHYEYQWLVWVWVDELH